MARSNKKRKREDTEDVYEHLIKDYFNRTFLYSTNSQFNDESLSEDNRQWNIEKLQSLKADLNSVKNLLSTFDIITWRKHTECMFKGSDILKHIKRFFKPELCTRAWCKFYEIVCKFCLVPFEEPVFNTFHLCEAPGAFVASLNHYLITRGYLGQWNWKASTLNPLYEGNDFNSMIDEDKFIQGSLDHWCFGSDDTGDIKVLENINHIQKVCEQEFTSGVHLVTCDGSIDCANEPEEQERKVFGLQFCEVVTSLSILKKGGSMVLKMFTMFEAPSVSLMYLVSGLFRSVEVIKPVSSKPGNSEVYIVATNFQGISPQLLHKLKSIISVGNYEHDLCLYSLDAVSKSFIDDHINCCQLFSTWQRNTILENVESYKDGQFVPNEGLKKSFVQYFLEECPVARLWKPQRIMNAQSDMFENFFHVDNLTEKKRHKGSLVERQRNQLLSSVELLLEIEEFNLKHSQDILTFSHIVSRNTSSLEFKVVSGKLLDSVNSSKFCGKTLLCHYLECLKQELFQTDLIGTDLKPTEDDIIRSIVSTIMQDHNLTGIFSTNKKMLISLETLASSLNLKIVDPSDVTSKHLRFESFIPRSSNDMENIILDQDCITNFIKAILSMKKNGLLLISMGPLLTRISAQIFLLLSIYFQEVSVLEYNCLPYIFIFAKKYFGVDGQFDRKLENVGALLQNPDPRKKHGVLSFLQIDPNQDINVMRSLHEINNSFIRLRISYLLNRFRRRELDLVRRPTVSHMVSRC